jgi:hypothetical protein
MSHGPDQTQTLLVKHLEETPPSPHRDELIKKARAGYYSDFRSPIATPKLQLREDLKAARLGDLARNVMEGVYD